MKTIKFNILLLAIILFSGCNLSNNKENQVNVSEMEIKIDDSVKENIKSSVTNLSKKFKFKNPLCEYNSELDTILLFKAWVGDPNGPSADFEISSKSFYKVDFDGIGEIGYSLIGNQLKLIDGEYFDLGEITKLNNDTLQIKWKATELVIDYVVWKN